MIFKFYDNINMLLPIETQYSEDMIYTEDSDLGTYALVNVRKWYANFDGRILSSEISMPIGRALSTETSKKHFLFMIDLCYASNSMKIKEELHQLSERIFSRYGSNAVIDICCFSYTQNLAMEKELMVTPYNKLVSMNEIDLILDTYEMYFGVNSNIMMVSSLMETPLDSALNTYNDDGYAYNFVFTFAPNRYCENDYYSDTLFEKLNAIPNFHASYIVPSESSTRIVEYVSKYTDKYSGKIFYSSLNLDEEIYSFIKAKCESQSDQTDYFWNNYFKHDITKEWIYNSTDDMDKDGVLDRHEINIVCIKSYDSNGKAIFKSFEEVSNFQDKQAKNGMNEMKSRLKKYGLDDDILYASKMILYNSYPNLDDSDGDGYKDKYDPSCTMEMDSCFETTDSFNVDIFDLMSDTYIDIMENPEYGLNVKYNSEKPKKLESLKYELLNLTIQNGGCMVTCIPGSANLFKFFTSFNFDYNLTMDTMPVAADCLLAYSLNKYTIKQVPLFDASIGGVRSQRFNYYKHMNMMMSCAENVLVPDNEILIKTRKNASEFGINYEVDSLQSSYSNFKSAEFDWYIAIGGGQNAIVSDIKCFEEDNDVKYTAKVKYYLFDVYDWQDSAEHMLYNLHLYGICKSFYEHCYFENTITWSKGMRYPKYDNIWSLDISETEFKGISDSNLKNALKKSKEVYMFS